MKSFGVFVLISEILFVSCTQVVFVERDVADDVVDNITININSGGGQSETRMFVQDDAHSFSGMNNQNYIENDDTIGIFPDQGDQIPFIISGLSSPQTTFSFESRGWGLKSTGVEYFAYLPFERKMNFKHYNNIEDVYVNYFGQKVTKEMADADAQYDNFNINGSEQSYYSYMYSEPASPTLSLSGETTLFFQLRYLGGWIHCDATIDTWCFAPGMGRNDTYFILAKIVASNPIFKMEGTYNLKDVGTNRSSLAIKASADDIVPTKRGLTNVLTVQLDSLRATGSYNDFYFSVACPPVDFNVIGADGNRTNATIYLYDSEGNYYVAHDGTDYQYDLFNGIVIQEDFTQSYGIYFKYKGKASPEDLKVEPWDDEEESINSNWNYK